MHKYSPIGTLHFRLHYQHVHTVLISINRSRQRGQREGGGGGGHTQGLHQAIRGGPQPAMHLIIPPHSEAALLDAVPTDFPIPVAAYYWLWHAV